MFRDAANKPHGFLLSDDTFTTIDYPGAVQTRAFGINPRGDIVGDYNDAGNNFHGFLLRDGVFTSIDFPGPTYTDAWGISPWQVVVRHTAAIEQPKVEECPA